MWFFGKEKQKISIDLSGKKAVSSVRTYLHRGVNIAVLAALLLTLVVSFYFYTKYARLKSVVESTAPHTVQSASPAQTIISAVDKHILLPTGEEPNIARVSDLAPLKGYIFFRNATIGDEVVVYCKAQLSILYSPTRDKLIEVTRQALSGACK